MKIGILTHRLNNNYGGFLQAYAMQRVLNDMGHEAYTIIRSASYGKDNISIKQKIKCVAERLGIKTMEIYYGSYSRSEMAKFIDKYFPNKTKPYPSAKDLGEACVSEDKFDAYVVGSDQVWRQFPDLEFVSFYFLDFAQGLNVKRVAYAASLGVDYWDFSPDVTAQIAPLAKQFDAVSVREDSGIKLCKEHLGVEAVHLLDPTMLLEASDYNKIIEENETEAPEGQIAAYILDVTPETEMACKSLSMRLGKKCFLINKDARMTKLKAYTGRLKKRASIWQWLRYFRDADFIITDSFHGTVFSIIFNKPFIALGNENRGNARFDSLLKMFNLESRLCCTAESIERVAKEPIDWNKVNSIKKEWQKRSMEFLSNNLK